MLKELSKTDLAIAGALTLQACLLFVGFARYGAHPDELGSRLMDMVMWTQWRPFNYYYPTTHQYFLKLITIPIADIGHFKLGWFPAYDVRLLDLMGRVISSFMAMGCSILAYAIARTTGYEKNYSLVFLLFFASFPLLNNLGRYNTTDVPNLFWVMLSILATLHAGKQGTIKWLVIAGLTLGLAAGVKFLAALFAPALLMALLLPVLQSRNTIGAIKQGAIYGTAAAAGFLISTPFLLIDPASFISDLKFLSERVPVWNGRDAVIGGIGLPRQVLSVVNPVILGFCFVGLCRLFYKWREPLHLILLISAITIYLFMFRNYFYPLRFVLPLYGTVLLSAGIGLCWLLDRIRKRQRPYLNLAVALLFGLGLLLQLRESAAITYNYFYETRYEASQWLRQNQADTEQVALPANIDTYFPVPLLPAASIYDTTSTDFIKGEPQLPQSVRYGLTSSMWLSKESGPAERFQIYMSNNWPLIKTFAIKPFLGKIPRNTEFLSPTIRIYERPERR